MTGRIVRAADAPVRSLRLDRGTATDLVGEHVGAHGVDLHVNRLRAGAQPGPLHYHTNSENVYYLLSGRLSVRIDDTETELAPGDAAFIPAGVRHSATNVGADDAVLIEIYAPAGADFVEVPPERS
jgi:mannose-6-phosphate isomerase-like protein (cupin superfamily)